MKNDKYTHQNTKTTKLWQRFTLTAVALFLALITEQLMWLGIGQIKSYYLRVGDKLDTILLTLCILTVALFVAAIICTCLYFAFRNTKIGTAFKVRVLRSPYRDNN